MPSNLTLIDLIPEGSKATPGLWNRAYDTINADLATLGEGGQLSVLSNATTGFLHAQVGVAAGTYPPVSGSDSTQAVLFLGARSDGSNYIVMHDPSGLKSSYAFGSKILPQDGLSLFDLSGNTMLAHFSKQSIRFFQNVVGPVFDIGGSQTSTLNAATFGTGADSRETRIQAAINAASLGNFARVLVPASMYPYSASSVSFIHTVQMVREGGDWSLNDVRAYGAAGDDAQNDTPSFHAAIAGLGTAGGLVFVSRGTYKTMSAITLRTGVTLRGEGNQSGAIIKHYGNEHCLVARSADGGRNITISDLFITDANISSRTTGNGIDLDCGVDAVSFSIERVGVTGMNDGLRFWGAITSRAFQFRSNSARRNAIAVYGPTTSTTFDVCYANSANSHGFYFDGGAHYCTLTSCVADTNEDGYHFGMTSGGFYCYFITLTSNGAELNRGHSFYFRDGYGHTILSSNANHTTGVQKDGFRFDGTHKTFVQGGEAHGVTGYCVNVLTSATPLVPQDIVLRNVNLSTNSLGTINDPNGVVFQHDGKNMKSNSLMTDGSTTTVALGFSSESSLGFYRPGAGTIGISSARSFSLNQSRLLSVRTLAASAVTDSAANTNLRPDEFVITIGGASGASICIHSGGTVYILNSALSAKAT